MEMDAETGRELVPLKASTLTARAACFNLPSSKGSQVCLHASRLRPSMRSASSDQCQSLLECTAPAASPGETEGDRTGRQGDLRSRAFPCRRYEDKIPTLVLKFEVVESQNNALVCCMVGLSELKISSVQIVMKFSGNIPHRMIHETKPKLEIGGLISDTG